MGASGTATRATLSISTVRASFPDALRLAAEVLREPAFPETEFEQIPASDASRTIENARTRTAVAGHQRAEPAPFAVSRGRSARLPDVR